MVIHPAPGNYTGTLVNAVLNHCKLPIQQLLPEGQGPDREAADRRDGSGTVSEDDSELSDEDDDEPRGIALPAASTAGFYEVTVAHGQAAVHLNAHQSAWNAPGVRWWPSEGRTSPALLVKISAMPCVQGTAPASNIRPGIVHRLDKGTTGLLVVAKTERALHVSIAVVPPTLPPFAPWQGLPDLSCISPHGTAGFTV